MNKFIIITIIFILTAGTILFINNLPQEETTKKIEPKIIQKELKKPVKKDPKIDETTGLIIDKGFEDVKAHCTVCHSAKFITLQKGDRDTWSDMIKWMQDTQGLWDLKSLPSTNGKNAEDAILTYLAKNYAPDNKNTRRPNLPKKDMPKIYQ